ncbi:hypothetical protein C1A50_0561 [Paenibacillus polymyxa]|nr:hypothetical protein C1A50_0561 [Paenibacillus polymyxa]
MYRKPFLYSQLTIEDVFVHLRLLMSKTTISAMMITINRNFIFDNLLDLSPI